MRKAMALSALLILTVNVAGNAMTFEGSVEKTNVEKKRSFWDRLLNRKEEPEGRIGVRISTGGSIAYVHPGSPADQAGLHSDDLVVLVDGKKHNIANISGEPGTRVHLEVKRKHDRFAVDVDRVDYHHIAN